MIGNVWYHSVLLLESGVGLGFSCKASVFWQDTRCSTRKLHGS